MYIVHFLSQAKQTPQVFKKICLSSVYRILNYLIIFHTDIQSSIFWFGAH